MTVGELPPGCNGGELSASSSISFTHGNRPCSQEKGLQNGSGSCERKSCPSLQVLKNSGRPRQSESRQRHRTCAWTLQSFNAANVLVANEKLQHSSRYTPRNAAHCLMLWILVSCFQKHPLRSVVNSP